mmetsp:Transcript_10180/g.15190  ORF Transcript_10180/g.15190 Transcript_10180/m.15190 type:complete len:561 (+) Transcript_10180:131-1813(+)|eukprot:CAMPEP_0196821404 /NCGR_PEP_ID=MMETSP1362-20130617/79097_1 /TAXON_ID=163516 /ORGANISM="Leptocylindrus danicus, Strain CCMP1856" /LENGTH=560 /DNA_ID=CAMNT_0042200577 /DNA_START=53 /DNA_END=1735 /DNA_ORIENTATION=-
MPLNTPYTPSSMLNLRIETQEDKDRRRKDLKRRGICLKCESVQIYEVGMLRRQPLTHANAYKGRCLVCYPKNGLKSSPAAFCMPVGLAGDGGGSNHSNLKQLQRSSTNSTMEDSYNSPQTLLPSVSPANVIIQEESPLISQDNNDVHLHQSSAEGVEVINRTSNSQTPCNDTLHLSSRRNFTASDSSGWDDPGVIANAIEASRHSFPDDDPSLSAAGDRRAEFRRSDDASHLSMSRSVRLSDDLVAQKLGNNNSSRIVWNEHGNSSAHVFPPNPVSRDESPIPNPVIEEEEHHQEDNAGIVLLNERPSHVERNVSAKTGQALDFLGEMKDLDTVVQCLLSMLHNAALVEDGIQWLMKHSETSAGAIEILEHDTALVLCLDGIEMHQSNVKVIQPTLELLNRMILYSIEQLDYSKSRCHYSHKRGVYIDTVMHAMDYDGLKLSRVLIQRHVKNVEIMKLVCEMLWTFCIGGGEDESVIARQFVKEDMVKSLQFLLEEQADFNVLANVLDVLYFVIESSDVGRRQLVQNRGEDALRNVQFICDGMAGPGLQSSLSKVLQLVV